MPWYTYTCALHVRSPLQITAGIHSPMQAVASVYQHGYVYVYVYVYVHVHVYVCIFAYVYM
jgi:hypothetical protein